MPSLESNASSSPHHNMWYSFSVGAVHFAVVSTETDFPNAPTSPRTWVGGGAGGGFGDQLGWLRRDLAAARADPSIVWVVVVGHRPWHGSKDKDWPVFAVKHLRDAFEPIMLEFEVDLYLCGHRHYYERTVPIGADASASPNGTITLINGAAGNVEGLEKGNGVGGQVV